MLRRPFAHRLATASALAVALVVPPVVASAIAPPTALHAGINEGTSDSMVGTQRWTFRAVPGSFQIALMVGQATNNAASGGPPFHFLLHTGMLKGNKVTFKAVQGGYAFHGTIVRPVTMTLDIVPPSSSLLRLATAYTIEATGDVAFVAAQDPVIGTYLAPNGAGAVKFLPGGTIQAANGGTGHWSLFDGQLHIYAIDFGNTRYSLKLSPGQGLLDAQNANIVFQSVH